MTSPEIGSVFAGEPYAALLPIGATEQHGPHLGTGMDTLLADHLAAAVGTTTRIPVLPTLPYGCSIGHSHQWPGTVTLSHISLITILTEIGDSLYHSGVRRLFILNTHVGNIAPVHCALDTLRTRFDDLMVAAFNTARLSPEVESLFAADADDWHANAAETSLVLALDPSFARPDRISTADDPDRTKDCVFAHPVHHTSRNGVTGHPSRATTADGEALFNLLLDTLTMKIHAALTETPPVSPDPSTSPTNSIHLS